MFTILLKNLCLAYILLCLQGAKGRPDGAPSSACVSLTPPHSGGTILPQTSPSPYALQISSSSYTPGQQLTVSITGSQDYAGILLQARIKDSDTIVGTWDGSSLPDNTKPLTCDVANDAVTHSSTTAKSPASSNFIWNAPSSGVGTIVFMVTLATEYTTFWVKIPSQDIIEFTPTTTIRATTKPPATTTIQTTTDRTTAARTTLPVTTKVATTKVATTATTKVATTTTRTTTAIKTTIKTTEPTTTEEIVEPTTTESSANPCSSNPCQSGGQCIHNGQVYLCLCNDGTQGSSCGGVVTTEAPMTSPCNSDPCLNSGICLVANIDDYLCVCPSGGGWGGTNCEINEACNSNPCLNSGTCLPNAGGGFTCLCASSFYGIQCENQCDAGVARVNCFTGYDPCTLASCTDANGTPVAGTTCVFNKCGGCNAVFVDSSNSEITCPNSLCASSTACPSGQICYEEWLDGNLGPRNLYRCG